MDGSLSLLGYMGQGVIILLGSSFSIFAVFNPLSPRGFLSSSWISFFFLFFLAAIWLPKVSCPLPTCPEAGVKVFLGCGASEEASSFVGLCIKLKIMDYLS